jgi:hypothetical protein
MKRPDPPLSNSGSGLITNRWIERTVTNAPDITNFIASIPAATIAAMVAGMPPPLRVPRDLNRQLPARKRRRSTLASMAKAASKAGIPVARYEVKPDGTIVVVTGAPAQQQGNEVDEWIAKHARAPERH